MIDKLIAHVRASGYPDATEYRVENSRPNPHLKIPDPSYHDIDCTIHPRSECVVIRLHDVYYCEKYAAVVAESACGHLQTWMD